jgi:hypothetical protein
VRLAFALVLIAVLASIACGNVIARKYEYEEEVFLDLDGSATVYVNASVPALVSLRGVKLPIDASARLDRQTVRDLYQSPATEVASVTTSRREGRRYVHLRLNVSDIRTLGESPLFAWSEYAFRESDGQYEFSQTLRASAAQSIDPAVSKHAGWDGSELVAVRLHLPSVITFHNSPSKRTERGNIVVWEQLLTERQKGTPLEIVARMETQSILFRTLALFAAMAVLVVITFIAVIWYVKSRQPAAGNRQP